MTVLVSERFEDAGFLAAFTERLGGTSDGPFHSLNLGLKSGDDPALVRQNRQRLCQSLGVPAFAMVRQVHGSTVVRVGRPRAGAGFDDPANSLADADALVTSARAVPVAILTADCVPIALADPSTGRLAVVHAGWRGIAAGIVRSALEVFEDPDRVMAAIGPAIGPDHYEVEEDVARAVAAASPPDGRATRRSGRVHLDLPRAVERTLADAGVRSIERAEECTACEPGRFFSYRRDGMTGRQGLVAVRW